MVPRIAKMFAEYLVYQKRSKKSWIKNRDEEIQMVHGQKNIWNSNSHSLSKEQEYNCKEKRVHPSRPLTSISSLINCPWYKWHIWATVLTCM